MHPTIKPDKIGDVILGYRTAQVLFTAIQLDLFSKIGHGNISLETFSQKMRFDEHAANIFLESLCALGYLGKSKHRYRNSALSKKLLVHGSPSYVGDNLKYQGRLSNAWANLGRILKTGKPRQGLDQLLSRPEFSRDYIRGMDNIARKPAEELASRLRCREHIHLLDIGAGSGSYSTALLKRNRSMTATLFDLPSTLPHTRALIATQSHDVRRRIQFAVGDYHTADFGVGNADMALLSHVTHDESAEANKKIISRLRRALRPGGRIVIHDFMSHHKGSTPLYTTLFSMHLRVYTQNGRVYSEDEYVAWLHSQGFKVINRFDVAKNSLTQTRVLVGESASCS